MKFLQSAALLLSLLATSCLPPTGSPPTENPRAGVDCIREVGSQAIADAQQRATTVIVDGVTNGSVESVIVRNLEGLGVSLLPGALACALQYLGSKFDYDAEHATTDQARQKQAEARVAKAYFRAHPTTFLSPAPN